MNAPMQEEKWRKRINLAAATLFALILIGSLVVQLINSNSSVGQTSPTPVPATSQVNPTTGITKLEEIPALKPKHGWLILATLHGIGNKTLNAQKLNLPKIWGTYLSCQGNGQASIQIQLLPDESIDTITCTNRTTEKPRIIIESFYGYTKELRINAGHQARWRLQIMGCRASASTCGVPTEAPSKTPIGEPNRHGSFQVSAPVRLTPTPAQNKSSRTPAPKVRPRHPVHTPTVVPTRTKHLKSKDSWGSKHA